MSNKYILKNKKVVPIDDVLEWGKWFETADRVVKQETLPNGKWVSTVFLGLDHNFGAGKPKIFETMVFKSNDELEELDCRRCSTWEEAVKQHEALVKRICLIMWLI